VPVGAGGGHNVVGVGDCHDPSTERDLVAHQPVGVSGSVVFLVVLDNGVSPHPEPARQGRCQPGPFEWVIPYHGPLFIVELAVLVEDVRVNRELADIMKQCGPAKAVPISGRQVELGSDEFGEGPHPFAMTTGQTIMGVERRRQGQDLLRG
jgi:hypothetical protein